MVFTTTYFAFYKTYPRHHNFGKNCGYYFENTIYGFKTIRFAKAPIKDVWFKTIQPFFTTVVPCSTLIMCYTIIDASVVNSSAEIFSEDYLFLNLYTTKLPFPIWYNSQTKISISSFLEPNLTMPNVVSSCHYFFTHETFL